MSRFLAFVLLTAMTARGSQIWSSSTSSDPAPVTFNNDVLPILQRNCQSCHRPGEVAPMSFLTYESTRPWAKAIKAAVLNKKMPPWFADPRFGGFRNAPSLTQAEINSLAGWADSGAKEGKVEDKPSPVAWVDGWRIQPDVVVSMPEPYHVRAKGAGEIKEFFVPNPFKEDTWVSSIEIRPGDPSVVHHVIVQVPEQRVSRGFSWGALNCTGCSSLSSVVGGLQQAILRTGDSKPDERPAGRGGSYPGRATGPDTGRATERITGLGTFTTMEAVYAPGGSPLDFRFHDSAKLIRGGKDIRIEVHYTPNGRDTTDRTSVGFTLAKAPAQRRFVIMAPTSLADTRKPIPSGESNWETSGELTFIQDAELVWFMPHMHLRGKDMSFRLIYPNGRTETVLSSKFNFQWQLGYEVEDPIKVPKGTKMIVTAHHDNSANNPFNPDPNKDVSWGELTSQEMMLPWFGVVVKQDADPEMIAAYRPALSDSDSSPAINSAQRLPLPTPPFIGKVPRPDVLRPAIWLPNRK